MSALILIAAGDSQRLDRMRVAVEKEGAVALTASDPCEAMRLFVRRAPDVTLLHVDPAHDIGLELCRDMKSLREGRTRPVVVVGSREARPQAFAAGCDAFVQRQADARPLRRAVRRLIEGSKRSRTRGAVELMA